MSIDQAARLRQMAFELKRKSEVHHFPADTARAKFIAVTSGKGGVGKSNISANLAISLAKKGKKVTLIDLDLGLANVDILLNVNSQYTLQHLFKGFKNIEDIIEKGPEGIDIIAGGSGLNSLTELNETQRTLFLNSFYTLARSNDYIIFDTAAGISNNVIKFVLAADEVIVVTTQEPPAITDAYALMKVLSTYGRQLPINVVINMVKSPYEARRTFEKLSSVVERFLQISVHDLGYVLHDTSVNDAIMKRRPFYTMYPFSSATKSIKDVRKNLLAKIDASSRGSHGFIKRIVNAFSSDK
jgi:flagellar biosynthesis protein FlhG